MAESFAAADPYVRYGLVTGWRVRAWATVVGDRAAVVVTDGRIGPAEPSAAAAPAAE